MIMSEKLDIYQVLTKKYKDRWSICNTTITSNVPESQLVLFVDLVIDDRVMVGCAMHNIDFTEDVTEKLLTKAVISAYKKFKHIRKFELELEEDKVV